MWGFSQRFASLKAMGKVVREAAGEVKGTAMRKPPALAAARLRHGRAAGLKHCARAPVRQSGSGLR